MLDDIMRIIHIFTAACWFGIIIGDFLFILPPVFALELKEKQRFMDIWINKHKLPI